MDSPPQPTDPARQLAHDLRGPLNAIRLAARLLLVRDALGPDDRTAATSIEANVRTAAEIVDGLAPAAPALRAEAGDEAAPGGTLPAFAELGLRVLIVEDADDDRMRLEEAILGAGPGRPSATSVSTLAEAEAALAAAAADVVLLDLNLPDSSGLFTVKRVCAAAPHAAIVVLTATDDPRVARAALRAGAQDYIVKGQVDRPVLLRAIAYARERKLAEGERTRLMAELAEAQRTVSRLSGIVPICAGCKAIRDAGGEWQPIEQFVHAQTEGHLSHGLCPGCAERLYPDTFGA